MNEILLLITYVQMYLLNAIDDVLSEARCLKLGLCELEQCWLWEVYICADSPEPSLLASALSTKSHAWPMHE